MAPYFQSSNHTLFQAEEEDEVDSDQEEELDEDEHSTQDETQDTVPTGSKRKRKGSRRRTFLLPAKARLGNVLVIVQIHAEPSVLPLPTLSKVSRTAA